MRVIYTLIAVGLFLALIAFSFAPCVNEGCPTNYAKMDIP